MVKTYLVESCGVVIGHLCLLLCLKPLMVRSAKRVSNHEAPSVAASFETPAPRAPQDEEADRS
jgi:hypothetical protein